MMIIAKKIFKKVNKKKIVAPTIKTIIIMMIITKITNDKNNKNSNK